MTPERFRTLLAACGSDLRRWPAHEQAAAHALEAQAPAELQQAIAEAALLDNWLGGHAVAAPGDALVQRVLASAPLHAATRAPAAAQQPAPGWRWGLNGNWLMPGVGLAGAGLAGTLAGALAVSVALRTPPRPAPTDWAERITAFSEPSADWREE